MWVCWIKKDQAQVPPSIIVHLWILLANFFPSAFIPVKNSKSNNLVAHLSSASHMIQSHSCPQHKRVMWQCLKLRAKSLTLTMCNCRLTVMLAPLNCVGWNSVWFTISRRPFCLFASSHLHNGILLFLSIVMEYLLPKVEFNVILVIHYLMFSLLLWKSCELAGNLHIKYMIKQPYIALSSLPHCLVYSLHSLTSLTTYLCLLTPDAPLLHCSSSSTTPSDHLQETIFNYPQLRNLHTFTSSKYSPSDCCFSSCCPFVNKPVVVRTYICVSGLFADRSPDAKTFTQLWWIPGT